jgi:hypothetical protein
MGWAQVPGGGAGAAWEWRKRAGATVAACEQGRRERGWAPGPRSAHAWAGLKE